MRYQILSDTRDGSQRSITILAGCANGLAMITTTCLSDDPDEAVDEQLNGQVDNLNAWNEETVAALAPPQLTFA